MSIATKPGLTLPVCVLATPKSLLRTKREASNLTSLQNQKESPFTLSVLHTLDTVQPPLLYFSVVR